MFSLFILKFFKFFQCFSVFKLPLYKSIHITARYNNCCGCWTAKNRVFRKYLIFISRLYVVFKPAVSFPFTIIKESPTCFHQQLVYFNLWIHFVLKHCIIID